MAIIGGADGPTSVFLSGTPGWLNLFGLILVALLLLPNLLYALKSRAAQCRSGNRRSSRRLLSLLEQAGRYGCMLLMVLNPVPGEFGFPSPTAALCYFAGNGLLLLLYWGCWIVYYKKPGRICALLLALLPALLFLLSGLTLRHWLLAAFALLFGICHVRVTLIHGEISDSPSDGRAKMPPQDPVSRGG